MRNRGEKSSTAAFEEALAAVDEKRYVLRLYVTGTTSKSMRAIVNIRKICDEYLEGRYELEVIDVYQQPDAVKDKDIIAIPTLVKEVPLPIRKLIGDLSNLDNVLIGLDIVPKS